MYIFFLNQERNQAVKISGDHGATSENRNNIHEVVLHRTLLKTLITFSFLISASM